MGAPREMVDAFLKHIRFPLMSHRFLSNDVYLAGILTDKELLGIFRAKTLRNRSLTIFSSSRRRMSGDFGDAVEDEEEFDEDDGEFDDLNMEKSGDDDDLDEEEEEKIDYQDITGKIQAVMNSGEYGGHPMTHMYVDGRSYWSSLALSSQTTCWIMFDCKDYEVHKMDIKFQVSYAPTIVKVYTSDSKSRSVKSWDKVTKRINMPRAAKANELKIRTDDQGRYLILQFEDWTNGYVGVERVHFYQMSDE